MAIAKRSGSTRRFGPRYGRTIKQKVEAIESKQKKKYECPSCNRINVKRLAKGIWECRKCSHKFAGKAFYLGE
ncbi:50S ribosomal protein L37ae [Candidatus Woesearchaeota archaeon]|nr:50S ribosomal protein L37ae [Candidatus Woesearchaeota archaeon]